MVLYFSSNNDSHIKAKILHQKGVKITNIAVVKSMALSESFSKPHGVIVAYCDLRPELCCYVKLDLQLYFQCNSCTYPAATYSEGKVKQ